MTGYRVAILSPEGTVIDTIDLTGYDLRNPIAANGVGGEVMDAVDRHRQTHGESFDATQEDFWICVCGNDPCGAGLWFCDTKGEDMEPLIGSNWDGHYRCDDCGRVGKQADRDPVTGRIPVLFKVSGYTKP